jgi:lysophospholipase L1-like esterase
MKRMKTIGLKCCIALSMFLIMIGLTEFTLRLTGYQMANTPFSWFHDTGLYRIDPELIYRTQPNYMNIYGKEYTNELGMKIKDPSDQRITMAKHILVALGDSFIWGETSEGDTYPQQLQNILTDMKAPVKVYNAGISGYGTDQEYMYFMRYVLPNIHPDLVVWNINTNDIQDNIYTPLFDIQNGTLTQIPLWTNGVYLTARLSAMLPVSIKRESRLVNLILRVLERVRLHRVDTKDYHQWAFEKIRLEIKKMQELAEKNHFTLLVASDPMQCIVEQLDCQSSAHDETNTIEAMVDNKTTLIDQSDYLQRATASGELYLDESKVFPKGWWHPDARGNYLMARSVVDNIQLYQNWILQ